MPGPKLIFLHIPKTAGQSVHHFLEDLVGESEVSPVRSNDQLRFAPVAELERHRLVSGHLDWCRLDCIKGPKFVFTILRDPTERVLSFYFYLRRKAASFTEEQLAQPDCQTERAALQLPCDEFFLGGTPGLRGFIDNLFDNFYTYFFAGRHYEARQHWQIRQNYDPRFTDQRILEIAADNLGALDGVYTTHSLARLQRDVEQVVGRASALRLAGLKINADREEQTVATRLQRLRQLGATDATFRRIAEMTEMDHEIWRRYAPIQFARGPSNGRSLAVG